MRKRCHSEKEELSAFAGPMREIGSTLGSSPRSPTVLEVQPISLGNERQGCDLQIILIKPDIAPARCRRPFSEIKRTVGIGRIIIFEAVQYLPKRFVSGKAEDFAVHLAAFTVHQTGIAAAIVQSAGDAVPADRCQFVVKLQLGETALAGH